MNWFVGRRILVPFDYSNESLEAVKVAMALAGKEDEVHALHVLVSLPATDPLAIWDEAAEEKRKLHSIESMEKKLGEAGIEGVKIDVGLGDAGTVIADLAEEIDAGLIVIPSHGYSGLRRFLLGSVAEKVVRHAKCPVLVLKKSSDKS